VRGLKRPTANWGGKKDPDFYVRRTSKLEAHFPPGRQRPFTGRKVRKVTPKFTKTGGIKKKKKKKRVIFPFSKDNQPEAPAGWGKKND